jgi:hypothetical protein
MMGRSRNLRVRYLIQSCGELEEALRNIGADWQTEIKDEADLIGPGAAVGTVPTDLEQATGLERFEILGKMQGIDVFDMKPLDASRKGTVQLRIIDIRPHLELGDFEAGRKIES